MDCRHLQHVMMCTKLVLHLQGCHERKQSTAVSSSARHLSVFCVMRSEASRFSQFVFRIYFIFKTLNLNTFSAVVARAALTSGPARQEVGQLALVGGGVIVA